MGYKIKDENIEKLRIFIEKLNKEKDDIKLNSDKKDANNK